MELKIGKVTKRWAPVSTTGVVGWEGIGRPSLYTNRRDAVNYCSKGETVERVNVLMTRVPKRRRK